MKVFAIIAAILVLGITSDAFARGRGGGGRVHYGGGHHTSSHGGYYSSGHGSSHRGGTYRNIRTGGRYGTHR